MESPPLQCPTCHQPTLDTYYFCPNCGTALRENPKPVSLATQIGVYALCILLPPFGYWPAAKYIVKKYPPVRHVGIIALILTTLSTALTLWAIFALFQTYLNQYASLLGGI